MGSYVVATVFALMSWAECGENAQDRSKDIQAIKQIEKDWQEAWNRDDMNELASTGFLWDRRFPTLGLLNVGMSSRLLGRNFGQDDRGPIVGETTGTL
jgi:hypothetical protein